MVVVKNDLNSYDSNSDSVSAGLLYVNFFGMWARK